MEARALADRAALLTAAATRGAVDYEPLNVSAQLDAWDQWLSADPAETDQARLDRWADEQLEVA